MGRPENLIIHHDVHHVISQYLGVELSSVTMSLQEL